MSVPIFDGIMKELETRDVLVATGEQVFSELDDEIIILDLSHGEYYGLNEVGSFVWKLLQKPRTVDEVCNKVTEEYDVDPEVCREDVIPLLSQFAQYGLVKINPSG